MRAYDVIQRSKSIEPDDTDALLVLAADVLREIASTQVAEGTGWQGTLRRIHGLADAGLQALGEQSVQS